MTASDRQEQESMDGKPFEKHLEDSMRQQAANEMISAADTVALPRPVDESGDAPPDAKIRAINDSAPVRIFLYLPPLDMVDDSESFDDMDSQDITWGDHQMDDLDVEYVRADLASSKLDKERIAALEGALREARKGLEILNDFSHNEECEAFGSGYDEDEIADNPLECLKGCDCGLAASWRATEIIDLALTTPTVAPTTEGGAA